MSTTVVLTRTVVGLVGRWIEIVSARKDFNSNKTVSAKELAALIGDSSAVPVVQMEKTKVLHRYGIINPLCRHSGFGPIDAAWHCSKRYDHWTGSTKFPR